MSHATYSREREVATEAVLRASKLCTRVFQNLVSASTIEKKDKSPVTIADYGAQAVVNSILHAAFPEDPIVGEEDSVELRENEATLNKVVELANSVVNQPLTSSEVLQAIDLGTYAGGKKGRFWTLDPIDGTKGFLRGEQFAVCLALIVDGQVQLGVMGCPNLPIQLSKPDGERGCLLTAVRNGGAYQRSFAPTSTDTQIHVSSTATTADTQFCESVEAGHSSQGDAADIASKLGITKPSVRMDSQCKYAVIARGDAGIYLRLPVSATYEEKIWDHAGGALLVHEAGGKVCDAKGNPLDFSVGRTLKNNKGVIATNGKLHDAVMDAVGQVLASKI
ncbi:3'(2'),5'-bisphosphate nucleotidase [Powellomyces hirtus]|uniref:3'(2'),5'-bisphosphate nucleotidase n=1 Tax=Powellomyces hirtus TaxID=109895 RepID=A0A507E7T8_9FUNG|nr:3'(2'),5'-bisphosphate nucleotidase [Powellomyces hirtus]